MMETQETRPNLVHLTNLENKEHLLVRKISRFEKVATAVERAKVSLEKLAISKQENAFISRWSGSLLNKAADLQTKSEHQLKEVTSKLVEDLIHYHKFYEDQQRAANIMIRQVRRLASQGYVNATSDELDREIEQYVETLPKPLTESLNTRLEILLTREGTHAEDVEIIEEDKAIEEGPIIPEVEGLTKKGRKIFEAIWPTFNNYEKALSTSKWANTVWNNISPEKAKKRLAVAKTDVEVKAKNSGLEIVPIKPEGKKEEYRYYLRTLESPQTEVKPEPKARVKVEIGPSPKLEKFDKNYEENIVELVNEVKDLHGEVWDVHFVVAYLGSSIANLDKMSQRYFSGKKSVYKTEDVALLLYAKRFSDGIPAALTYDVKNAIKQAKVNLEAVDISVHLRNDPDFSVFVEKRVEKAQKALKAFADSSETNRILAEVLNKRDMDHDPNLKQQVLGAIFQELAFQYLKLVCKEGNTILSSDKILKLYSTRYQNHKVYYADVNQGIQGISLPDGLVIGQSPKNLIIKGVIECKCMKKTDAESQESIENQAKNFTSAEIAQDLGLQEPEGARLAGELIYKLYPHLPNKPVVMAPTFKVHYALPEKSELRVPDSEPIFIPVDVYQMDELCDIVLKVIRSIPKMP